MVTLRCAAYQGLLDRLAPQGQQVHQAAKDHQDQLESKVRQDRLVLLLGLRGHLVRLDQKDHKVRQVCQASQVQVVQGVHLDHLASRVPLELLVQQDLMV